MSQVPSVTRDISETIKSGLVLWVALTCPSNEDWLYLMETVIQVQLQPEGEPASLLDVIIEYMSENIPEA